MVGQQEKFFILNFEINKLFSNLDLRFCRKIDHEKKIENRRTALEKEKFSPYYKS